MKRLTHIILVVILIALCSLVVTAEQDASEQPTQPSDEQATQPSTQPSTQPAATQTVRERMNDRLEALSPDDPMAYFELGEEVADLAETPEAYDLARHLFGLAGALAPDRLGCSACLALADLESDPLEKQRLLALSALLDEQAGGGALYVPDRTAAAPSQAALTLVEAFSYYRRGEGTKTRALVNDDTVLQLMDEHDRLIPGGVDRFLHDARVYRDGTRPDLQSGQLRQMLYLELALLTGENRQWSTELALTDGEPLIEVDPNQLAQTFGVDPERPLYRNGRWVSAR